MNSRHRHFSWSGNTNNVFTVSEKLILNSGINRLLCVYGILQTFITASLFINRKHILCAKRLQNQFINNISSIYWWITNIHNCCYYINIHLHLLRDARCVYRCPQCCWTQLALSEVAAFINDAHVCGASLSPAQFPHLSCQGFVLMQRHHCDWG